MNVIEIICEHIDADPKGTVEEITEALQAANEEQVTEALTAVIVAAATQTPKQAGRRR